MYTRTLLAAVVLLLLAACSSGGQSETAFNGPPSTLPDSVSPPLAPVFPAADLAALAVPRAVADLIQEVAVAPVPDAVDPVIYEELRAELIRVLSQRRVAATGPVRMEPTTWPGERTVSFTPYGISNKVNDLTVSGEGPYYLTWTYSNRGDYDLNGMVNVSDLTPIGVYYGKTSSDPLWYKAAAADGDGNGMITVSDITPLGQYFGGTIIGYQVWTTESPSAEWTFIGNASVETNLRKNPLHTRFVIKFDTLDSTYYSLWPYDNSDDEGGWSNIATPGLIEPRRILKLENIWDAAS